VNGEGAPHRLLQPILRHVHLLPIARLPVCSVHFRSPNPTNGVASAGTPGRFAFDDATRASVDPSLTRSAIWRSRAPLNPGGLRYRWNPRRGAPRSAALSSAGEECASTSDAPCRDELRAVRRPRFHGSAYHPDRLRNPSDRHCPPPEPPFLRVPSRALIPCDPRRLPSTSARSTRRPLSGNDESRTRARHRSWGFAALQSGFQRSFAASLRRGRWLDRGRYRALFTPGRSWPRAARRLLQSKTICKHDLRTSKPGSRQPTRVSGSAF
jgi:hypothetical protein